MSVGGADFRGGGERIVIVGTGRLGRTILRSFPEAVVAVISRQSGKLPAGTGLPDVPVYDTFSGIASDSFDILWLAVPDGVIAGTAGRAAGEVGDWQGKLAVHSSGATSLSELDPLRRRSASTAVLHPNLIIGGERTFPEQTIWGVTLSSPDLRPVVSALLRNYSSGLIEVPDDRRTLYHLAATIAANYPMALFEMAAEIYRSLGITPEVTRRLVQEYMEESIRVVADRGISAGLTGPVARGDEETIREHIAAIKAEFPLFLSLFRELVERTRGALQEGGREGSGVIPSDSRRSG